MRYTGSMLSQRHLPNGRLIPLAILAASAGALGTAYVAEVVFGLEPCILCLYQRVPYAVTGVLAVLALSARPGTVQAATVGVCAVVFAAGAAVAFYHVGVEQHWWASAACGGELATDLSPADMIAQLSRPQPKTCDEVDWTLFGLSIATYNVFASLALAGAALAGARMLIKAKTA
ncbi:MAG TPA: disulfide bond formation protein B [Rhodospirillales bacterium]|nr:disulfide bond formation protein B [Rhodospirillales bacterium]